MIELLRKLEGLKERGLINTDDVIKLRGNIQRNRLSASLMMNLVIKLSDEIEILKGRFNDPPKLIDLGKEDISKDDIENFIKMVKDAKPMPINNVESTVEVKSKSKSKEL